ncbi:MAG: hypothetical protein ACKOE2_08500 [Actinomycetales bacterium]
MNVLLPDMTLMFPNSAVRRAIAVAAPSQYRQLDGAGLIGVLPSGTEAPAWLGQPTQADAMAVVPTQGLTICYVGNENSVVDGDQDPILGRKADLGAYSFVNFGRFPNGGYSNMISRISQFPSTAAADAAWANLLATSRRCVASWVVPYPITNDTVDGTQAVRQTVRTGDSIYGSASLVITTTSSGTRTGATAPDRTGASLAVWRHLGNVIYQVEFNKAVQRDVRSAVSVSDRMTINAVSALIGERYLAAAAE